MSTTGIKLGRFIGRTGAYALEGVVRIAEGSGRFGADVLTGVEEGYEEQRVKLLAQRAAAAAKRDALLAAGPTPVTSTPASTKPAKAGTLARA